MDAFKVHSRERRVAKRPIGSQAQLNLELQDKTKVGYKSQRVAA